MTDWVPSGWRHDEWVPLSGDDRLAEMMRVARLLGAKMGDYSGGGGATFVQGTSFQAKHLATSETTSSVAYVDLATVGPAVTLTIGPQGVAVVFFTWGGSNTAANQGFVSAAVSGGDTVAASDNNCVCLAYSGGGIFNRLGGHFILSGLTPGGSDTFTPKYRVNAGTGTFNARDIGVLTY